MEKKSNKGLICLVVILVLALLGTVGYILYDKGVIKLGKDETVEKTEVNDEAEEKSVPKELGDELIQEIDEIYNINFSKYYSSSIDSISNQDLLVFGELYVRKQKNITFGDDLSGKDIKELVSSYFDRDVKHEDIICRVDNNALYKYDSSSDVYKLVTEGHGHGGMGDTIYGSKTYYIDGKVVNNTVVLNTKIIYGQYIRIGQSTWGPTTNYYSSYEDSKNRTNSIIERESGNYYELTNEDYQSVKDKLPTTTFVFEKKNDNYVLKKVEVK